MCTCTEDKEPSEFDLANNASVIAYLNMMQAIITRLAGNSVQCKTWCFAIVGALVGLAGATKDLRLLWVIAVPLAAFSVADAFYLAQERKYRDLYNGKIDLIHRGKFKIEHCFVLQAKAGFWNRVGAFFSWSVLGLYAWPVVIVALYLARRHGLI